MEQLDVINISRKEQYSGEKSPVKKNSTAQKRKAGMREYGRQSESRREGRAAREERAARAERNTRAVREERRRRRRRKRMLVRTAVMAGLLLLAVFLCVLVYTIIRGVAGHGALADVLNEERRTIVFRNEVEKPVITEDFLTVNPNSRPGDELKQVKNVFVHYTANPGTSAAQNRSYFENLGITKETSASAHFIIGYEGEIIQCLPLDEIGYAVKTRNEDSISIECCYIQENGEFTEATYQSLVQLCAWLLNEYDLTPEDILRHYDEGGKKCPLYYVEHEEAWGKFLVDVRQYILDSTKVDDTV